MRTAIYPGSFDPITNGHLDIISRGARIFDKLIVLVSVNPLKPSNFSVIERVDMLNQSVKGIENVEIDSYDGLLIDYFNLKKADVIIKGLRAMSDFEYEFQMALANKKLHGQAETMFLASSAEYTFLSSSMVRQIAMFDGDITGFVPECIHEQIKLRLKK